jgi:hypothetical protein
MIVCEINTRRVGRIMKYLPHGRRVHVGGALHGVRQGAGQDAAAGLLVHRSRHRLANQGGCRSRVLPWRRFKGHESHGVDIRPAPQDSQHGGARETRSRQTGGRAGTGGRFLAGLGLRRPEELELDGDLTSVRFG